MSLHQVLPCGCTLPLRSALGWLVGPLQDTEPEYILRLDTGRTLMQKACPHCQSANALDARLCQNCGRAFEDQASQPNQATVRWTGTPVRTRRTIDLQQLFAR